MNPQKARLERRRQLKNNQHELYVVSFDEMDNLFKSSSKYELIKERWESIRDGALTGANYGSSGADSLLLAKLIADIGFFTEVNIKSYAGNPHIIIKGHPGLRKIFTGTKYGIQHPKVVKMGLSRAGAVSLAKRGGVLTIVLLTGFRVIDHVLTDHSTLSRLIGTIATDVVKVGMVVGASIAGAALGSFVFTIAVGSLLAAIAVGVATSFILDSIDEQYDITEHVIHGAEELGQIPEEIRKAIQLKRKQLESAKSRALETIFDYIVEEGQRILINTAKHTANKLLQPNFR